jgi:hypothetical protein
MGLSESAIETLLHRARRRFKAEYLYLSFVESKDDESCDSLQELLGGFGLRSLKRNQRARVKEHVDRCPDCQAVMMAASSKPGPANDPDDALDEAG